MLPKAQFHVLVLDDDTEVTEVTRQALLSGGFTTITASLDLEESKSLLSSYQYHLIILDLHFHKLEGLDFLREIRNGQFGEFNRQAYVFIQSGWVSQKVKQDCELLGVNAILEKPFKLEEFLDFVSQAYEDWATQA
jgi:CheY-like chemotaxis protein